MPFFLANDEGKLVVKSEDKDFKKPFFIDFFADSLQYRLKRSSKNNELLAKAVGMKKSFKPFVIDATAGLGRDALILAHLGCKVVMLERSPVLQALLNDALQRAQLHAEWTTIDLNLITEDSKKYLANLNEKPDVIYLDPMYPARTKSALVKKEMRLLRELVGDDQDADELFEIALKTAAKRIVVKRPSYADNLAGKKPDFIIEGSQQRFDVYIVCPI